MEKIWYVIEKSKSASVYTIVTSINLIGNLTSPLYNGDIERKFDKNDDITNIGLTMDDFDSDYSNIIQELSYIKKDLIGEPSNDIISKFASETISDKTDDWLKTCNNIDHFAHIRQEFSKIKITYDHLFCSNNNNQKISIVKNGRYITNKKAIIIYCNEKIKILKKNMKLLLNDCPRQGHSLQNSIKKSINTSFNNDDLSGEDDLNNNILNNLRKDLEKITKITSVGDILYQIKLIAEMIKDLIVDDIMYFKGDNRNFYDKSFDTTLGNLVNYTRAGRSYSMAYTFYEMYIEQVIDNEIIDVINLKKDELDKINNKLLNIENSYVNIGYIIQENISDGLIFHFVNNPTEKFYINIGNEIVNNYLEVVDKINNKLISKYPENIVQGQDRIEDGRYFEAEYIFDLGHDGIPAMSILFKSNRAFVINRMSSILPYLGYVNNSDVTSWTQSINNRTLNICYGSQELSPQFTENQRHNKKTYVMNKINSSLTSLNIQLGGRSNPIFS